MMIDVWIYKDFDGDWHCESNLRKQTKKEMGI